MLILLYADTTGLDEEVLLLYETFSSKNPDFPHGNYKQFDLDSMTPQNAKQNFVSRSKTSLALERIICDDIEGLCMFLKRVAYPCWLSDMIP